MQTTPFIIVNQHYKSRLWQYDCPLLDLEHVQRAQASLARITRSSHPVAEILEVDPPVPLPFGCDDIAIMQPKQGGAFYSLKGRRVVRIISQHQTKPWK